MTKLRNSALCYLIVALLLFANSCSEESVTNTNVDAVRDPIYPSIYPRLSADSLEALREQYEIANPLLCKAKFSKLDDFGFTKAVSCYTKPKGVLKSFELESFVDRAKEELIRNSTFTGVLDSGSLVFADWRSTGFLNENFQGIRIRFRPQVHQGLEVLSLGIFVVLDTAGLFSIIGNYFPEIVVPDPLFEIEELQSELEGLIIPWFTFGGQRMEYEVGDESFCHDTSASDSRVEVDRFILPWPTERGLELRVVWKFEVGCDRSGRAGWWLLVDVATGEHLTTYQLFDT